MRCCSGSGQIPFHPANDREDRYRRDCGFDFLLVESTGSQEPLPVAEPRLGRRTVLTLPLLPPPQKN